MWHPTSVPPPIAKRGQLWATGLWNLGARQAALRSGPGRHMLMLICLGRSRGRADVNVYPRNLYRMSLDRDGASRMESNPQGQHEDDKEEQQQGGHFKKRISAYDKVK